MTRRNHRVTISQRKVSLKAIDPLAPPEFDTVRALAKNVSFIIFKLNIIVLSYLAARVASHATITFIAVRRELALE
jgi:hypothetical protein